VLAAHHLSDNIGRGHHSALGHRRYTQMLWMGLRR
jgi:hypothetical protein